MFSQNKNLMHEMMIDVFLDLQDDDLKDKSPKEILTRWVTWIDARYKVAVVPDVCYAIIDCENGEFVSLITNDLPDAKRKANEMCASLNHLEEPKQANDDMLDAQVVADAFLDMDDDSFMDFLLNHTSQEKEE